MRVLITGVAGFIGFHVAKRLLQRGDIVIGLDNLNDYYDVSLKRKRLELIRHHHNFDFVRMGLEQKDNLLELFRSNSFDGVINLAAQAGVRYSLENPSAYVSSNVVGFSNILESCRECEINHLVYASSSSVYGLNGTMPFSVSDNVDHPVSLYAATKKANELMAHTYSHLFGIPTTGLRFFTVYGPWGRPDMAYFLFTKAILAGDTIKLFNHGRMLRDFTYIDDVVEGVIRVLDQPASCNPDWDRMNPDPASSLAPFRVFNVGNSNPVQLFEFIEAIETALGKKARHELLPMQPGDVKATFANIDNLVAAVNYQPRTKLQDGIDEFVAWYMEHWHV